MSGKVIYEICTMTALVLALVAAPGDTGMRQ